MAEIVDLLELKIILYEYSSESDYLKSNTCVHFIAIALMVTVFQLNSFKFTPPGYEVGATVFAGNGLTQAQTFVTS